MLALVQRRRIQCALYCDERVAHYVRYISMQHDTQMVSVMYRTHKRLASNAKVCSLYAFDALARAARHQVNKHNMVADVNSEKGNCATFLLKIQGVLDGLFEDLIASGNAELKVSTL